MEVLPNNTFLAKTGLTDHDPDQDFRNLVLFMQKSKRENIIRTCLIIHHGRDRGICCAA